MRRRELMLLLGGVMTVARTASAQQKAMPVVGYLSLASPGPSAPYVAAFRQGLGETGYVEGQNLAIEYRWAEGRYDRLPALAAELVGRKLDVIVTTGGTVSARKAQPRRSLSSPSSAVTPSQMALSPASPGRAATSQALAFSSGS
jgi:putative ABC transport system substrate-binding protein